MCVVQIQSKLSPRDWPDLAPVCEHAVAHALPFTQASVDCARGPLMDAANRLVYLRISEREASSAVHSHVLEREHAQAVQAFVRRRACSIIARAIRANLERIKAKLWHPHGRLMAKRFALFKART